MTHCNGSTPCSPLRQSTIDYMTLSGLAARTQQAYLRELDKFADHVGAPPAKLGAEQVEAYVLELINSGLKPRSTNLTVAALRMFYRHVVRLPDRVAHLRMRKVADKLPNTIAESEVKRLIQATFDLRYRTAIEVAYGTGLR